MKLLRAMGMVGAIKVLAKVSAVFRDRAIALVLGTGDGADMFFLGFNVTGGIRSTLAEEPLKAAFLPLYAERAEEDRARAWTLVNTVVNAVGIGLAVLGTLWAVAAPVAVEAVGGGNGVAAAAVQTVRILAVTLVFGGLSTVSVCVLTVNGRFAVPASLPLVMNLFVVAGALALYPALGGTAVALGVVAGAAGQAAVQLPVLYRCGYRYRPVMDFSDPLLRQLVPLFVPVMLMQGLVQVNIVIDTAFAAGLDTGSISYLYYGNRIMLFPYDILAMAVSMVAFPALARAAAHHDRAALTGVLDTALGLAVFFSLPAMAGGIVLARPLVDAVFGGVMDGEAAVTGTARALAYYLAGLPAFIAVRILYPVFYSLKKTRIPLVTGSVCLVLNVVFDVLLMRRLGYAGLALSSSLAAVVNVALLLYSLYRQGVVPGWRALGAAGARSVVGACAAAAGSGAVVRVLPDAYHPAVPAAAAVMAGVIAYLAVMRMAGSPQLRRISDAVRGA